MNRIEIKPLSVNNAWKGRRFKTQSYQIYEHSVLSLLRPMTIPKGDLVLYLEWGFSSAGSDFDNPVKPFLDCLQKKYGFNDNRIVSAHIRKVKVVKGEEYIEFDIQGLRESTW